MYALIGLPGSHELAFREKGSQVKRDLSLFGQLVLAAGIFTDEDPDHAQATGRANRLHQGVHGHIGHLMSGWVQGALGSCLVIWTIAHTARSPRGLGGLGERHLTQFAI